VVGGAIGVIEFAAIDAEELGELGEVEGLDEGGGLGFG